MDKNHTQSVRLTEKLSNLSDSLTVIIGSANSNFDTGSVHNDFLKIIRKYSAVEDCSVEQIILTI